MSKSLWGLSGVLPSTAVAAILWLCGPAVGETFTVTASVVGTGGTIEPAGKVTVAEGAGVTFRFKPEPGYAYTNVKVDGRKQSHAHATVTLKDVRADHTISVAFKKSKTGGFKTRAMFGLWVKGGKAPPNTISPDDLVYEGAFRLPRGGKVAATWGYSGSALAYYPDGDPTGPDDGHPGSLFGIGHPYGGMLSEVAIPAPVIPRGKDRRGLNTARTLQPFTKVHAGLTGGDGKASGLRMGGLAYLPAQADGQPARLYFGMGKHFPGRGLRPNHGWCEPDLTRPRAAGLWNVGDVTEMRSGYNLFEIPAAWAREHTGGKTLATGRARWGQGCGAGPHLYAVAPWRDGVAGKPPAPGAPMTYVVLLDYAKQPIHGYRFVDAWEGGAWLTDGDKGAVVLNASLGYGCVWYDHAYFSDHRMTALQFFDPADLAAVARGDKKPHEPRPYAVLDVSERMVTYNAKTQKSAPLMGTAYDRKRGLLYAAERRGDGTLPLVHVWRLRLTGTPRKVAR